MTSAGQPKFLHFVDGVSAGAWPSWTTGAVYGQGIDYGIDPNNGHEILVTDTYNLGTGDVAINLYDLTLGVWGTHLLGPPEVLPTPWDVILDGEWVFVAGERGFFAAELVAGSPTSQLVLRDHALTYDAPTYPAGPVGNPGGSGWSFQEVRGIARFSGIHDRLFVSLADPDGLNGFALAMYDFDPMSGDIGDAPLSVLFDGQNAQPDDFPGIFVQGGGRMRTFTYVNETQVFSGTQNGHVLQVSYFQHSDQLTSLPLQHWHNGAFYNETSDCQVSNLAAPGNPPDLRLTVPKWLETFAIVKPFGFQ